MAARCKAAYRSVLRELIKSSITPRATRNQEVGRALRTIFDESCSRNANPGGSSDKLLRDMGNVVTFLRAQRVHKELLDRYNPLHDLSQEERVMATARRVGLNTPMEHGPGGNDK